VIGKRGPSDPGRDVDQAITTLAPLLGHRWRWRPVAFGPCPRCYWPAHTLGPNGQPWHAFCWGNPDPPTWWDRFLLRESRKKEQGG
jgi:hypothetical protein